MHRSRIGIGLLLMASLLLSGCATVGVRPGVREERSQTGWASHYARHFQGRPTSSGERYDGSRMTAAHPTLPFGTKVRVTRLDGGGSVVVRINDRGPFRRGRIIDLSWRAARELGLLREGTARVRVELLDG